MTEYTDRLNGIVRLLSQTSASPWLISGFLVVLGIIGGAIGIAVADFSRHARARRMVYEDIGAMFSHVDTITTFKRPWDTALLEKAFAQLVRSLDFRAEELVDTNRDISIQLAERSAAKHIYNLLHRIEEGGSAKMVNNCGTAEWMLGKYIRDGKLPERYFRRYLTKAQAHRLITCTTTVYDESLKQNTLDNDQ